MQSNLPMHQSLRCGAKTRRGGPSQSPGDGERPLPDARGPSTGAPKGNRHAFKHGRHTAEAVAERKRIEDLVHRPRESHMRQLCEFGAITVAATRL
jgi:hypothetical protein